MRLPDAKPAKEAFHAHCRSFNRRLSKQHEPRVRLEIAVLREDEGRGGSTWIHTNVRPGDRLKIRGPRNHFRMDESLTKVMLIAGGIGITPVSAMAGRAQSLGMDYELHYSGRSRTTMAFTGELASLHGERLRVYASDEGSHNDLQALLAQPHPGTQIYACGPVRMLKALEAYCGAWPGDALQPARSTIATWCSRGRSARPTPK